MQRRMLRIFEYIIICFGIIYLINGRFVIYSIPESDLQNNVFSSARELNMNVNMDKITRTDNELATIFLIQDTDKFIVAEYSKMSFLPLYRLENPNSLNMITKSELMNHSFGISTSSKFVVFSAKETKNNMIFVTSDEVDNWKERICFFVSFMFLLIIKSWYLKKQKEKENMR